MREADDAEDFCSQNRAEFLHTIGEDKYIYINIYKNTEVLHDLVKGEVSSLQHSFKFKRQTHPYFLKTKDN